jgi:Uma2 family endonuclease
MAKTQTVCEWDHVGELLEQLGDIAPSRVRLRPAPGTATVADLVSLNDRKLSGLFEMVQQTLVEKVMGASEGGLALDIAFLLRLYLMEHNLGDLFGADAPFRILPEVVRLPDISFLAWEQLPSRQRPSEAVPSLYPDLAVEILSEGNTPGEMARKRREYFFAGTRLVWEVDPRRREIDVYTGPDAKLTLPESDTLTGDPVLPGFTVPVAEVFRRVPRPPEKKPTRKKR